MAKNSNKSEKATTATVNLEALTGAAASCKSLRLRFKADGLKGKALQAAVAAEMVKTLETRKQAIKDMTDAAISASAWQMPRKTKAGKAIVGVSLQI